jgi:hypothetical protein
MAALNHHVFRTTITSVITIVNTTVVISGAEGYCRQISAHV